MTKTAFGKAWALVILSLIVLESFFLGFDAARGETHSAIADGLLLALWGFAAVYFHVLALREQKLDFQFEQSKKSVDDSFKKLIDELKKDTDDGLARRKTFLDLFKEVTGVDFYESKNVSAKQKATIEKHFNEATGTYADITVKAKGVIGVEISDKPFATKTVKKSVAKKAPIKKTVTKKKGTK
jgi:hypothetical protein